MLQSPRFIVTALLVLLVGCASLTDVVDFDDPEVELVGLEPMAGQGLEARFLVSLRIVNPNGIPLDIDGMAYDVYLRDKKVLSGVSNEPIAIEAYGEGIARLEVAAGMFGSLALIRDLMSSPPDEGLPYKLNAKISRKGIMGAMRISREGNLELGKVMN